MSKTFVIDYLLRLKFIMILICLLFPNMGIANQCMQAIQIVSNQESIPKDVLMAVALTETGVIQKGRLLPYPWAINIEGKGFLFSSKKKAIRAVKKYLQQGKTSVDIGCMQLNWYWHKNKFNNSVEKAFEPITNVTVGAEYIKEHYTTYKNWNKAVGRYHSGTEKYAKAYYQKYVVNLKVARNNIETINDIKPVAITFVDNKNKSLDKKFGKHFTMLSQSAGALIEFHPVEKKSITLIKFPKILIPIFNTTRRRALF